MRRSNAHNNSHSGGANEFHLDVPPVPMWQNGPVHMQLLSANITGHHTGMDHLSSTSGDQMDRKKSIRKYI